MDKYMAFFDIVDILNRFNESLVLFQPQTAQIYLLGLAVFSTFEAGAMKPATRNTKLLTTHRRMSSLPNISGPELPGSISGQ